MRKTKLLILVMVLALLLIGAAVLYNILGENFAPEQLASQGTENAEPAVFNAPDFTVYDLEGNPVKLSDFAGKPIVLNFWASWCGPCKREMPDFNEIYGEMGDSVQFLMVNMTDGVRETVETASNFIADQGYSFPVYYDVESQAAIAYRTYALPTSFFLDAEGNVVTYTMQAIDAATLRRGIEMIMPQ